MSKGTCSKRGCRELAFARGLCRRDYGIAYRRGEIQPELPFDIHSLSNVDVEAKLADCALCGPQVPIRVRIRDRPNRLNPLEVSCGIRDQKDKRDRRKSRRMQPESAPARKRQARSNRQRKLREKYRMTLDDYGRMFAEQEGRCLICCTQYPSLVVDHNHVTGAVRGLLCSNCNSGLGFLQDNADLVERAARYLRARDSLAA